MNPVNTFDGMLDQLSIAFEKRYRLKDVNITGILFARPESAFVQKEILPHVDYWYHRSDFYTDFFCPGYFTVNEHYNDGQAIATVGGDKWFFSNEKLTHFLTQMEKMTSWRYSGGCELIVTNARCSTSVEFGKTTYVASLDLASAIAIDLQKASQEEAFRDVSSLTESIFEFAKNLNESTQDPCWEYSDQQGMRIIKSSLKEMLLSRLPSWVKPEARRAFHFATRDISVA